LILFAIDFGTNNEYFCKVHTFLLTSEGYLKRKGFLVGAGMSSWLRVNNIWLLFVIKIIHVILHRKVYINIIKIKNNKKAYSKNVRALEIPK